MTGIGIIGFGYWGPNLLRNFASVENAKVVGVADLREERYLKSARMYPSVKFTKNADELISDPAIDAIVIATPVSFHFPLALRALDAGKHVMVEKPLAATGMECETLINRALRKNLVLMVDHTFLYTGAVRKLKELIKADELGTVKYYDSTRINLGLFQSDVNVLWDLAPHDISILLHLIPEDPVSLNATGISHTANGIENIAYMTLKYGSGLIAHFNCSWTSPVKIRQILIGGDKKMILFNDMEPSEKIKVYDSGYSQKSDEEKRQVLIAYRTGDVFSPKIEIGEALQGVANDFIQAITKKTKPVSDYTIGMKVVRILEAANESLKKSGSEINLL